LSRAAYYHAMRKDQEENRNLRSPFKGEGDWTQVQVKES
jgi:hypothetical protein